MALTLTLTMTFDLGFKKILPLIFLACSVLQFWWEFLTYWSLKPFLPSLTPIEYYGPVVKKGKHKHMDKNILLSYSIWIDSKNSISVKGWVSYSLSVSLCLSQLYLVHMKNEIQLANILKAFVQRFNKHLK